MTRRVVQLAEWQSNRREAGVNLSDADRALARALTEGEGRLSVQEVSDGVRFDASAWIGVVRFSEVEVRVVPKLVGENLGVLQMLEYSSGLGALSRLESARTLAADRDGSLVDLLALLLAEGSIDIAKRGILHDYVGHEDALSTLRGRLLPDRQATHQFGQLQVLECRFDELETNIAENQLLTAALAIAKRVAHDHEVRRLTARAHAVFSEVADGSSVLLDEPELEYNRRNEHYRAPHEIARMFLRSLAVNDLYSPGAGESFAFMVDMNVLFESFVTKLLVDLFATTSIDVRPQRRDRSLILDARTAKPYMAVIPDVLLQWEHAGRRRYLPVDAKYKLYDDKKLDSGDVYQTFFYAWAYADDEKGALSFILYPGRSGGLGTHLLTEARSGIRGASIRAIPIDVPAALRAIRDRIPVRMPEITQAIAA